MRMMGGPRGVTVIVMKCVLTLLLVVLAAIFPCAASAVPVPQRASLVLVGEHRSDRAGASVARAGDVNGDGHGDLIVGAPRANPLGRRDAGAAYVVFGPFPKGRLTLGHHGFRIAGAVALPKARDDNPTSDGAGALVAGAGDVNGDGLADLLVSGHDTAFASVTFLVFGKRDSAPVDLAALGAGGSTLPDALFGIWPVGDLNGDHRADVAVGVDIDGDEGGGALEVIYSGGGGFLVRGIDDGGLLGSAAAAAGDVDHDGFGDVLIGAPGVQPRGAVYLLRGRAHGVDLFIRSGEPFRGRQINGPPGARGFGASVARYGDGLVAGAPGTVRSTKPGSAWIVTGRTVRLAGPRTGGPAGIAVATARGRRVLVLARGRFDGATKALLYSADGRRLRTYTGLRNVKRTRASIATVGGSLLFGSPGASAAYLVSAR
jgi:FG-GAP repeat protein